MSIYVDGKLDVSQPRSGPIATNNFPVCIGENIELTGHCWNGFIDDVRIYTYALSENEIAALATVK
jgi:MSHA biogenesis protein MshQ